MIADELRDAPTAIVIGCAAQRLDDELAELAERELSRRADYARALYAETPRGVNALGAPAQQIAAAARRAALEQRRHDVYAATR
jgi:hypothetical protein